MRKDGNGVEMDGTNLALKQWNKNLFAPRWSEGVNDGVRPPGNPRTFRVTTWNFQPLSVVSVVTAVKVVNNQQSHCRHEGTHHFEVLKLQNSQPPTPKSSPDLSLGRIQ